MELDRSAVLACYGDGIAGIRSAGASVSDWDASTPCGQWTTLDIAGHLLSIVRYYHRLLDAVSIGRPEVDLPRAADLATMNARDLAELEVVGGVDRVQLFCELAEKHLSRVHQIDWDTTLGTWSGLGDLTVGQHTGIAIGEWHVHAWDLARASGTDHRPSDASTIRDGQQALHRATDPGDPWIAVLRGYGRDPAWKSSS
jgi:hypothetical protein